MGTQEYLGIGAIVATVVIGIISWLVSAYLTKKNLKKQKIKYEIKLYPLISKKFITKPNDLEVYFQKELLEEPTLLAVDIINAGNVAIVNPPIEIETVGAMYLIPGYIEELPPGYENLWRLERRETEASKIFLDHINPGQTVKARFFLGKMPESSPVFKCAMADVEVQEVDTEINNIILNNTAHALTISFIPRIYINLLRNLLQKIN